MGRFINKDPIEEKGGLNLYAFCSNNGVNRWDYLGMKLGPVTLVHEYADGGMDGVQNAAADGVLQLILQAQHGFERWSKEREEVHRIEDILEVDPDHWTADRVN